MRRRLVGTLARELLLSPRLIRAWIAVAAAAPMERESVALAVEAVGLAISLVGLALRLGLRTAGDERRQPVAVAGRLLAAGRLRARRLRPLFTTAVRRLLAHRKGLRFGRQIGLRLARAERLLHGGTWRFDTFVLGLVGEIVA